MTKHLAKDCLYTLPSGAVIHPSRLIQRDGTLMWKHVFTFEDKFTSLPTCEEHETNIIKTAHRIEELNVWVSQSLEPWECLKPYLWYHPDNKEHTDGTALYFYHTLHNVEDTFDTLHKHINPHETLELVHDFLYFKMI